SICDVSPRAREAQRGLDLRARCITSMNSLHEAPHSGYVDKDSANHLVVTKPKPRSEADVAAAHPVLPAAPALEEDFGFAAAAQIALRSDVASDGHRRAAPGDLEAEDVDEPDVPAAARSFALD